MYKYLLILILCLFIFFPLFGYSINENYENNNKIPKIIIQTWKTKEIPEKYKNDMESVKKYNSKYKYLYFTDDDINNFIKNNYPQYYSTYKRLPVIIQKIDFFRYIAVYHYGGFYFDLDITGLYPLDELLDYDCIFPVDTILNSTACNTKRFKKYCSKINILLGQYAFGAKPKNLFIKKLIDTINDNIDNYIELYKTTKRLEYYVYSSTGPDFVTDVYLNYPNKKDIHILEYPIAEYFGKYAIHNHYGTWKK